VLGERVLEILDETNLPSTVMIAVAALFVMEWPKLSKVFIVIGIATPVLWLLASILARYVPQTVAFVPPTGVLVTVGILSAMAAGLTASRACATSGNRRARPESNFEETN
jgi:hypothetical protein